MSSYRLWVPGRGGWLVEARESKLIFPRSKDRLIDLGSGAGLGGLAWRWDLWAGGRGGF